MSLAFRGLDEAVAKISAQVGKRTRRIGADYDSSGDSDFSPDDEPTSSKADEKPKAVKKRPSQASLAEDTPEKRVPDADTALPPEVWGRILAFATAGNVADIIRLRKVSRRFRDTIASSRLLW